MKGKTSGGGRCVCAARELKLRLFLWCVHEWPQPSFIGINAQDSRLNSHLYLCDVYVNLLEIIITPLIVYIYLSQICYETTHKHVCSENKCIFCILIINKCVYKESNLMLTSFFLYFLFQLGSMVAPPRSIAYSRSTFVIYDSDFECLYLRQCCVL